MAGPTVLLMDDDSLFLWALHRFLENQGIRALLAYNLLDAVRAIRHEEVDFVITDCEVAGASGLKLARKLKEYQPALQVLLVCACQQDQINPADLSLVDYYFNKPVEFRQLHECLVRAKSTVKAGRHPPSV